MRSTQFDILMERLDNAYENGWGDELEEMEPSAIFHEIVDTSGERGLDDVDEEEIYKAINAWKERRFQ